jgi:hypothetical protein
MKPKYERALRALPLPRLMRLLGVPKGSIRENDGVVRCPWFHRHAHKDRNKSCSIYHNMTRIHCFVCGYNYNIPGFVAAWRKTSEKEGYRYFMQQAEGRPVVMDGKFSEPKRVLALPPTWDLTAEDMEQIAALRQIDIEALQWAVQLGLLRWAEVCKEPSWLLYDSERLVAEARTLSGALYPAFGDHLAERKAHTIRGSLKAWPVGTALLRLYKSIMAIMLVEGGPDLLAAFHFLRRFGISNVLPVALLGANAGQHGIAPEALKLFHGKHVRLYPHNDPSGRDSLINWLPQLKDAGCKVSRVSFAGIMRLDGTPANDLNDLTSREAGSHEPYRFLFA